MNPITPDNATWYYAAYCVTVVVYVGYAASIWWRRRSLRAKR